MQFTKNPSTLAAGLTLVLLSLTSGASAATPRRQSPDSTLYLPTFSYAEGRTHGIRFAPTYRVAEASGEAKVQRKSGMTEIEIELDEMKTALHFGGDFATYVLWAVSPEGQASNLGEFVLKGNRSKLDVSTYLQTFGLMVTAEPHFMVESPSRFVVLSNEWNKKLDERATAAIKFEPGSGEYVFTNTRLTHAPESSGAVRTEVRQANVALQLAERAGAPDYASSDYKKAREALDKMILAVEEGQTDRTGGTLAREAIRLAVRAEKTAVEGSRQAAIVAERVQFQTRIAQLNTELDATRQTLETEIATARNREHSLESALDTARERTELALSKVVETSRTAEGLIVSLPGLFFDTDRATLKPEAREVLSRVAGILHLIPGFQLQLMGHSDSTGEAGYNKALSLERAQSVAGYLVSTGIGEGRISVEGFGEARPVASNETPEGRGRNRRVELAIVSGVAKTAQIDPEE